MKIKDLLESNVYRPLSTIAQDIRKDWKNISPHAKPYLDAMLDLDKLTDNYIHDSGRSIVAYFLAAAASWRGENAKRIKVELKAMLAGKQVSEAIYDNEIIVEGINFAVMQQKIYDYVLKKLKEKNSGMHASYASELARTTDQFFTTAFDDIHDAFNKADDKAEVEDNLRKAIESVSGVVVDFFADEMNHPTGYAARKLIGIEYDDPTDEEIEALIKKIDPNLDKELADRS